ncbi:MAG: tRNA (N6-threonylcarbamoyladenosine(37)-N6)-methyltransferase TrmO [Deltaproteobacteria bacterium]|nr:MAG: tRNA (N6-threonylcarbamoyladenosine(37)-N6)-methyltransferase TrmO [Deltaproteobacteria bacterium]
MDIDVCIRPIGTMRCDFTERYETPRQPAFAGEDVGVIELSPGMNFEQAVVGLEGFSHLWVLYGFHKNKPAERPVVMVRPPRYTSEKVGVFATRSPHRPNPIGMSCVRLVKIEGRRIHIQGFDLLDGTPVLDIKPYLPMYDAHPEAITGWLQPGSYFKVCLSETAKTQQTQLTQELGVRLDRYASVQLQEAPLDETRKRIEVLADTQGVLSYQEWRIHYRVDLQAQQVLVTRFERESKTDRNEESEGSRNEKMLKFDDE